MPGTRRAYLNDNVRTAHLKCGSCRTQVYLIKIESNEDGWETRTFACPHCSSCKSIRLAPLRQLRTEQGELRLVLDQGAC